MEEKLKFELTEEQAEFLKENVLDMSADCSYYDGHSENYTYENYKKDFILTEEHEKMIEELHEIFYEIIVGEIYKAKEETLLEDDVSMEGFNIGYRVEGEFVSKEYEKFFLELSYDYSITYDEDEYDEEEYDEEYEDD